jgi:hypothetical protein
LEVQKNAGAVFLCPLVSQSLNLPGKALVNRASLMLATDQSSE